MKIGHGLRTCFNSGHYPLRIRVRFSISEGDSSIEVMIKLNKCGEVLGKETASKETVNKVNVSKEKITDTREEKTGESVKKEIVTEIWYIRVEERGGIYCYPLSFEEGRLKSIGNWSKCD